ncbi:aldehyde dehydrogenase family protein [Aliihoeflea aestuarii]|uniref:aldehyde dehydrogenase n=1 Tax=Aliihoeflea aestuarii TaxID=453840 RepID=UPI0020938ABD|nr:aldehyde dehydrogenase [Aliihoeflea aestuarii]MCO6390838.1 aldehyde dehydrogenase family protein [Aliihoeflea aestuarii]
MRRNAQDGPFLERKSPVSGLVVTRVHAAQVADARHAANRAAAAFPKWSQTSPSGRREILNRAAQILLDRREEFIKKINEETGGTRAWGELNCKLGVSILREAAALTTQLSGEIIPADRPGSLSLAMRQPCGVVLSLAPWNAPVVLSVRSLATPLACGNTVVFKASELCPGTHQLVGDVFAEAGLPDGAVAIVHNEEHHASEIIEALIAHPAVRRVNFTGSTRSGRMVAEMAARHLKKPLLELGGKAPLIVLADADLDEAVRAAAFGAFFNQGQLCMSTERLLVDAAVADLFLDKLTAELQRVGFGDPANTIGPMISEQAAMRVKALVDDAVSKGARLVAGGTQQSIWMDATILDGVRPDMRIYYEESFGPVASLIRFADVEEAISIANDTEYGLTAAVFSSDVTRALSIAQRLETGICHINSATIHDEPQMPFGGVKSSGYGRFGGRAGIDEFTELRWITIQNGKPDYPI